jgi:ATP adenylyltransferase
MEGISFERPPLWAPWRMAYIHGPTPAGGCFLCDAAAAPVERDAENRLLIRGEQTMTVLNRYPYTAGHLLVAPRAHVGTLTELNDAVALECQQIIRRLTEIMARTMRADGFNVGLNLGRVAGAGLPGHLHWHVVPRWNGDTNFMPVLADVSVISQSLDALYEMLQGEWFRQEEACPP